MKILRTIAPFLLCVCIIASTPFAYKKTSKKSSFPNSTPTHKMILTLWNIDLFEGGTWSRTEFLSKVATTYSSNGVLIMVVSHTLESAQKMIDGGVLPDMISFSVGADFVTKYAKKLPKISFSGGEINGDCFAYPWCAGGYFLISKNQDNQPIERLFVSQNQFTMPFGVFYESQIQAKETVRKNPQDAYVSYLASGKNDCLIGTQRDIFRLEKRGVEFYAKAFENFSDIVQYISIFSSGERYGESLDFIKFLTGEKTQKTLGEIGMVSALFGGSSNANLSQIDFKKIRFSVSPFSNASIILNIIDETWKSNLSFDDFSKFKSVLKRL